MQLQFQESMLASGNPIRQQHWINIQMPTSFIIIWKDGQTDGWMNGWVDGDEWMDRWIYIYIYIYTPNNAV